ncbi:hypothetical protein AAG570_002878 [Ranatra chinensis]|uniref:Uncharacterized protein n=1 Tax=Ranatra chinensis TaxID=642074 RepID=A0ABD0YN47_9HEMI
MVEGGMDPRLAEEVVAAIYGVSRRLVGMEVRSAVGPGENYMSRIFRLRCIFRSTTTGGEEVETLVAKQLWQQQDEANRIKVTIAREAEFFRKENQIYTEVLPAMEEILRSTGDDEDVGWAKLMLSLPKERLLVFEDLADCGYSMVQRSRGLDLQHALIAAMQLARWAPREGDMLV